MVLIVVSLGAAQHRLGLAALAAAAAAVLVAIVGLLVARQLSEVPENTIKTVVGVMLTSFGVFWVGEGAGVHWPGSDLAIPVLVGFFILVFFGFTAFMRTQLPPHRRHRWSSRTQAAAGPPPRRPRRDSRRPSHPGFRPLLVGLPGRRHARAGRRHRRNRRSGLPAGRPALGRRHPVATDGGGVPLPQHVSRAAPSPSFVTSGTTAHTSVRVRAVRVRAVRAVRCGSVRCGGAVRCGAKVVLTR